MIIINQELQALIPALLPEELQALEASVLQYGCRDALLVWQEEGILLDGHNRYAICTTHGLTFATHEISLPELAAAKVWMIDNQLGRRNLSGGQRDFLMGERYRLEKQVQGGTGANHYVKEQSGQNDHLAKTEEKLSQQYKVSQATIRRDAAYAADINTIAVATDAPGSRIVAETEGKLGRKEVKAWR